MKYKTLLEKDPFLSLIWIKNIIWTIHDLLLNAVFKSKQDWKQLLKWDDI